MRELKLKYFIELASNIGSKARTEAQALEQSQQAMQRAVDKTSGHVGRLDGAFARFGANTATERQIGYMQRLATGIDQARGKMRSLAELSASALQKAPSALAGATAGFYTAKALLDKPMNYDMRLRTTTATAYAGKSAEELELKRLELSKVIDGSMRQARGSTRDQGLGAFELLVGGGAFGVNESKALLPHIMRTSVASSSDANDLARAAEKMKVNFGLTDKEIPVALSKMMRAGQEGGFEIKESSKWLGPLADYFKDYKGMAGIETMMTMLQQVRSTAGSNDEAANNLRNFVQKMKSEGTTKDFKKQGIDLNAEMAKGAVRGETPIDTYMAQLDRVMAKQDPEGKARAAMRKADKSLSPEENKARYDAVAEIYKRAGISKIINDLQEMGGYSGLAGTKAYGKKVLGAVRDETGGAVDVGYQFRSAGTGARSILAGENLDITAQDAFEGKSGVLNQGLDKFNQLVEEFPKLSSASYTAAHALGIAAASAGVFSLLVAKSAGARGLPGVPLGAGAPLVFPTIDGAAKGAGPSTLSKVGSALGKVGSFLGPVGMLLGMEGVSQEDIDRLRAYEAKQAGGAGVGRGGRGQGYNDPSLLTLTAPSIADQALALGKTTEIKLGEGKLQIDVRVSNDGRVTATPHVLQPLPLIRINPGATNPGGF